MSNDAKRWGNLGIDLDGTLLFKGKRMKAPATAAVREFLDNHWEELQDCVEEFNDEYWLDEIEKQKTAQQSGPPP